MSHFRCAERLFKSIYTSALCLWRYRTLRPDRAQFGNHWIYFKPADRDAYKRLIARPLRGKTSDNLAFWADHMTHLRPDYALDVGANYGECLVGVEYPTSTRAIGFEANPRLLPYLRRSIAGHPQADRIALEHAAVTDGLTDSLTFHLMNDWSGGSSVRPLTGTNIEPITVPAMALDAYAATRQLQGRCLLYKMDIEGGESAALRGGVRLLTEHFTQSVGLVEFDTQFLCEAGVDVAEYWRWLTSRFTIGVVNSGRLRHARTVTALEELPFQARNNKRHVDIILIHGDRAQLISPLWKFT